MARVQAEGQVRLGPSEGREHGLQAAPLCFSIGRRGPWPGAFRAQVQHSVAGLDQPPGLGQGGFRSHELPAIAEGVGGQIDDPNEKGTTLQEWSPIKVGSGHAGLRAGLSPGSVEGSSTVAGAVGVEPVLGGGRVPPFMRISMSLPSRVSRTSSASAMETSWFLWASMAALAFR